MAHAEADKIVSNGAARARRDFRRNNAHTRNTGFSRRFGSRRVIDAAAVKTDVADNQRRVARNRCKDFGRCHVAQAFLPVLVLTLSFRPVFMRCQSAPCAVRAELPDAPRGNKNSRRHPPLSAPTWFCEAENSNPDRSWEVPCGNRRESAKYQTPQY